MDSTGTPDVMAVWLKSMGIDSGRDYARRGLAWLNRKLCKALETILQVFLRQRGQCDQALPEGVPGIPGFTLGKITDRCLPAQSQGSNVRLTQVFCSQIGDEVFPEHAGSISEYRFIDKRFSDGR